MSIKNVKNKWEQYRNYCALTDAQKKIVFYLKNTIKPFLFLSGFNSKIRIGEDNCEINMINKESKIASKIEILFPTVDNNKFAIKTKMPLNYGITETLDRQTTSFIDNSIEAGILLGTETLSNEENYSKTIILHKYSKVKFDFFVFHRGGEVNKEDIDINEIREKNIFGYTLYIKNENIYNSPTKLRNIIFRVMLWHKDLQKNTTYLYNVARLHKTILQHACL